MDALVLTNRTGKDITTSLIIAEVFGKEHKHVLRDIQELECPEDFRQSNFGLSSYVSSQGKELPMYEITKDGFSFLAMGYTGSKAAQFKVKFINEFNKRESLLKNDDYIISRAMSVLFDRAKALEQQVQQKEEQLQLQQHVIKESAPKVDYYENVLQSKNTYTTTQVAKEVGFRQAEQLHLEFKSRGIMFKQSGQWMLTAKYSEHGYTKPRTSHYLKEDGTHGTNTITVWTEAGREFIHSLFKSKVNGSPKQLQLVES
jgi:Rha family phage regulatory protein